MVRAFTNVNSLAQERNNQSQAIVLPVATGGLNTVSPLASLPPNDAVVMTNIIPDVDKAVTRRGFEEAVSGLPADVESLFEYRSDTDTQLISVSNGNFYTGIDTAGLTQIGTGYANSRWYGGMMNNHLLLFNGVDDPLKYDGTTLTTNTFTAGGLTPSSLIGMTVFKTFLITWNAVECAFYYGGVNAISGPLNRFPLEFVAKHGGNVINCASWSSDGRYDIEQRLAVFMSTGEVIVYQGTDPSSATDWRIVGSYHMSQPISQKAIINSGGDLLVLNEHDVTSLQQVTITGQDSPEGTTKLTGAIKEAVNKYGSNYGWELLHYSFGNWLIINIPVATNDTYEQLIFNTKIGTSTGCKFTGMNARCFAVVDNKLYFGGDKKIYQADKGFSDDGQNIEVTLRTAWNDFGTPLRKDPNFYRLTYASAAPFEPENALDYDFVDSILQDAEIVTCGSGVQWDSVLWDTTLWSPALTIRTLEFDTNGDGTYLSFHLRFQIRGQLVNLYSILYSYNLNTI